MKTKSLVRPSHVLSCILTVILTLLLTISLVSCGMSANGATEDSREMQSPSRENGELYLEGQITGKIDSTEAALDRKIIRNATVYAETQNYTQAVEELEKNIASFGGYIQSSNVRGNSLNASKENLRFASFTICIPADQLDAFLAQIGGTLNVTSSHLTEQDVSAEYYDLESRIATLTAEKQRMTELLETAKTVSEVLEVEQRLYDIIEEYEAKQTKMNLLNSQIAYSRVDLTLNEVRILTEGDVPFGEKLALTFTESWQSFWNGCLSFFIWLVSAIPTLLIIGVIVGATITIVLSSTRHNRKKQAERKKEQNAGIATDAQKHSDSSAK